jgi:putative Holliday junction resolvase
VSQPARTSLSGVPALTGGRILAIDYGRARIGLALAESPHSLAQPFDTLERINRNEDMRRLRELVRDQQVGQILVGLPLLLDGTRGEMAEEAERFANRVRKQIAVPVEMVDERLTSWEAERLLEEEFGRKLKSGGASARNSKTAKISVDSVAATIVLREYLQRFTPGAGSTRPAEVG